MACAMKRLQIGVEVEAEINRTWKNLKADAWLNIEEMAEATLKAHLAAKMHLLFSRHLHLRSILPEYVGFEQTHTDHAVLEAAAYSLGRYAFSWPRESFDEQRSCFDDPFEDIMLTEFCSSASTSANQSYYEMASATDDTDDALLLAVESSNLEVRK